MEHVFISYKSEDLILAESFADKLRKEGFEPWLDDKRLALGKHWPMEIDEALKKAYALTVLVTPNSANPQKHSVYML